jgi:cytochrome c biogenesis protein CcdA
MIFRKLRKFLGLLLFLFLASGFLLIPSSFSFAQNEETSFCAVYFTGIGCPHCAKADPVILQDLFKEYPNLIIIEYEIYQQRENALLFDEYSEDYKLPPCVFGGAMPCSGLPMIIFSQSHQDIITGDSSILNNVREKIEELKNNPCPLINEGSEDSQKFEDLNLTSLPGKPKVWAKDRILIKNTQEEWTFAWRGGEAQNQDSEEINNSKILQDLIITDDVISIMDQIYCSSTSGIKVPLSGSYIYFDNAISFKVEAESEIVLETKLTLAKVLSLAIVDAINPCALAVLGLMLITILSYNPQKKRNVLFAGLAFIISVFIMYLLYGLIIIRSFQIIQSLTSIRVWLYQFLGAGAVILGVIKLKDFFRAQAVCNVVPKVNKIIAKITSPIGAFIVGAFVTIFLLPCTIGPYVICGGILCPLGLLKAIPLLLLYNFIFIFPMLIMVLIIYFGLSKVKDVSSWQARNIKYLDLVSGIVIIGLGVAMIFGLV